MRYALFFVFIFLFSECCCSAGEPPEAASDITVLFIGNSLTYTNNLPGLVTSDAKERGVSLRTKMVAHPNYALEDHWNDGEIQKLIAKEKYDFVVVQQGPSSQVDGRMMLLEYGSKLASLCEKHNSKLAFFMVWPAHANYHTFEGVVENYTYAASATSSLLCPVGRVWKDHMDATGDFSYYGGDGFHPSEKGSMIAAGLICTVLLANVSK